MEAVTSAIAVPLNGNGISAPSRRSLMDANRMSTIEKPIAPPNPNNADSIRVWLDCAFKRGMPNTAQLVVMRGRKIPSN